MSFWENYKKELKKEWGGRETIRREEDVKEKGSPWTKKLSRDEIFLAIVGFGIIIFIAQIFNLPTAIGAGVLYYFLIKVIGK